MDELVEGERSPLSVFDAQVAALRQLMPPIDAFGIGGSYGRGDPDPHADLDFFLMVSDDDFWEVVSAFPSRIRHPLPVVSTGVGRFMADYGFRLAFLLAGGSKVEYFFNSPKTMTPLPLSGRIRVLADESGVLTAHLETARAAFRADPRPHVAAGIHDCLVEIHDVRKHAARGDLLPLIWRITTLRRPVFALHNMATWGDVYAPSSAVSQRALRAVSAEVDEARRSIPTLDAASILSAYTALRRVMVAAWASFDDLGLPSHDQRDLEAALSNDIIRSLAALQ